VCVFFEKGAHVCMSGF